MRTSVMLLVVAGLFLLLSVVLMAMKWLMVLAVLLVVLAVVQALPPRHRR